MKVKKSIVFFLICIIFILIIYILFINRSKPNSYIYDNIGNEIAIIENGEDVFKNIKTEYLKEALNSVILDIANKENVTYDKAKKILSKGGYYIYTSQDTNILTDLLNVYNSDNNFEDKNVQSCIVIIDNENGNVVAMVGGRNNTLKNKNRAISLYRQPGYAITPLSVYACGLEKQIMDLDSIYVDEPLEISEWSEKNNYLFAGEMTVKEAFKILPNTISLKISEKIGINNICNFLNDLGISILEKKDISLISMALGNFTNGVNTLQMAVSYSAIANGGKYRSPVYYKKILDKKGNIYLKSNQQEKQIMKESTTIKMKELLLDNENIYSKITTTIDNKDYWANGFNNKYTISIWSGYDNNVSLSTNNNISKTIYEIIIKKLNNN